MSDPTPTYQSTGYRFVSVLNKKYETGRLMNTLGHLTVGLIKQHTEDLDKLNIADYVDADGTIHPELSDHPFIILKADNSNQIRTLRNTLIERKIAFTDFTNTMIQKSAQEQREITAKTKEIDFDYLGVCFFVDNDIAKELTKKFSLLN
ncbi:MAG: DUF2000 domain-containing protein [bacterium]